MIPVPAVEDTWRLEDIFPTEEAFLQAKNAVEDEIPGLAEHAGLLSGGASALADVLEAISGVSRRLGRLHAYASMRSDGDLRIAGQQALRQEVELAYTELSRRTAWLRPEILALPNGTIERCLAEETRLAPFAPFVRNLVRQKEHVLGPAEEHLLAEAGLLFGGPSQIFGILHNAEMPRASISLHDGEHVTLTPAAFSLVRTSANRDDRMRATKTYFEGYSTFRSTYGSNLYECLKAHIFRSRARRYPSCVAAALDADNVPVAVYTNLIEQVRRRLPSLHRYFRLRAKALGLPRLTYADLHAPLVEAPQGRYNLDRAKRLVVEAMAPLGAGYVEPLARAFDDRWIDWHPSPGKRSGAYATGAAYDVHPYMLLNFNGDFESVSTLAHEAGHAMHSHFSNKNQPYPCADYSIFVAEVASTFNEALLIERLLEAASAREERLFLLGSWLDGIRATLFRQTFFAEFELAIHTRAEEGEALTGEAISALYLDLLRTYQGHAEGACEVDDLYAVEWAAVPHFYYDFYVYQYSTGIVAANKLAADVLAGSHEAKARYLAFLSSGSSADPLELLRRAGVDLESPEPYAAAFGSIDRKLDDLESLL
jgi:oligoendopeptidase F